MTGASSLTVTSGPGPGPDLAASQRQAARFVTRRAARRAEREALDEHAGAATHDNAAIATHSNRPDPSHFLDTGHLRQGSRDPCLGNWSIARTM